MKNLNAQVIAAAFGDKSLEVLGASQKKALAANAAAAVAETAAPAGKQVCKVEIYYLAMSSDAKRYFGGQSFWNWLRQWEAERQASARQEARKADEALRRSLPDYDGRSYGLGQALAEGLVKAAAETSWDGFTFSYEEALSITRSLKGEALRRAKAANGENRKVLFKAAKALDDRKEVRLFLKMVNKTVLREKPLL